MKKFMTSVIAAALSLSAYAASAATIPNDSDVANKDTPQQTEQSKEATTRSGKKAMSHKAGMKECKMNMKDMDTNNDSKISRDEFMAFHERKFDAMKQTNGMVDMKDMGPMVINGSNSNSMNNTPIGTTTGKSNNGSTDETKDGPINGTHTGTN